MSAYVVSDEHITALVNAAISGVREPSLRIWHDDEAHTVNLQNAETFARMLKVENQISVARRYGSAEDMPGRIGESNEEWVSPGLSRLGGPMRHTTGQILAAIDCYEYQACEHGTWESSLAHAFCQALRRKMCRRVDGYEGSWSID